MVVGEVSVALPDRNRSTIVIAPGQRWLARRQGSDLVIVKKSTLSTGRWLVRRCVTGDLTTISEPQLIEQYRVAGE
jgi:hypothetical protein